MERNLSSKGLKLKVKLALLEENQVKQNCFGRL